MGSHTHPEENGHGKKKVLWGATPHPEETVSPIKVINDLHTSSDVQSFF